MGNPADMALQLDPRFRRTPDRLVGAVLIEAQDEWQASDRSHLSEASMARLLPPEPTAITAARHAVDTTALKTA